MKYKVKCKLIVRIESNFKVKSKIQFLIKIYMIVL